MLQLICEGKCNPAITDIDRDVLEFRKRNPPDDVDNGTMLPIPHSLIEGLHILKHTTHQRDGKAFSCVDCGGVRIFGWD